MVTRLGPYTPVRDLMRQTGWLSVRKLAFFHSVKLVHRVRETGRPGYSTKAIDGTFNYNTRAASTNSIRWGPQFRATSKLTLSSWRWRGVSGFNGLPGDLKLIHDEQLFKSELKRWVSENKKI